MHGSLESFSHATNEGVFDLADYYRYRNISFRMFADEIWATDEPGYSFRECLYQLQKRISDVFCSELNARDAGVLSALVTGNKGLMDQEVKDLYQDAGISHILAISGLHISVLGLGIFRFFEKNTVVLSGLGSGREPDRHQLCCYERDGRFCSSCADYVSVADGSGGDGEGL